MRSLIQATVQPDSGGQSFESGRHSFGPSSEARVASKGWKRAASAEHTPSQDYLLAALPPEAYEGLLPNPGQGRDGGPEVRRRDNQDRQGASEEVREEDAKEGDEEAHGIAGHDLHLVKKLGVHTADLRDDSGGAQDDLDHIWKAPKIAGSSLLSILRARVLSLGVILAVGFLLLISLVLSSAIAASGARSDAHFPGATLSLLQLWNLDLSVGGITVLFAMLHKWLPNVRIGWKDVRMGAFITAILFSAGRYAIGLYLGRSAIASAYGAAGTLVVLPLWLYYSAQVFLLGAKVTCQYATHRARCRSRAYRASDAGSEK